MSMNMSGDMSSVIIQLAERLRDLLGRDDPVHHQRAGDGDGHDGGGARGAPPAPSMKPARCQAAIPEEGEDQREEGADGGRLGRRHRAAIDAAEHDERQASAPAAHRASCARRRSVGARLDRKIARARQPEDDAHLRQAQQQAGDHAAHEKVADRGVRRRRRRAPSESMAG